jgi:hypothetical protein
MLVGGFLREAHSVYCHDYNEIKKGHFDYGVTGSFRVTVLGCKGDGLFASVLEEGYIRRQQELTPHNFLCVIGIVHGI